MAMRVAKQALLPFGVRERVVNRQIAERMAGQKVRRGPGRPKIKDRTKVGVAHKARAEIGAKTALHVTAKTSASVPNLRTRRRFAVIRQAFVKYCRLDGFRLIQFSILGDHLHLILEADSKQALSLGMQKLLQSISRRLNALLVKEKGGTVSTKGGHYGSLLGWVGRVFKDRYFVHVLKTPTVMERAVRYVIHNAQKHFGRQGIDPYSSQRVQSDVSDDSGDNDNGGIRNNGSNDNGSKASTKTNQGPVTRARGYLLHRACMAIVQRQ